jgi:hypothetical protein
LYREVIVSHREDAENSHKEDLGAVATWRCEQRKEFVPTDLYREVIVSHREDAKTQSILIFPEGALRLRASAVGTWKEDLG